MASDNEDDARLWTPADLARFIGYKESTIIRMCSMEPDKLPPRVGSLRRLRWVPEVCRDWVRNNSIMPGQARKPGRPRRHEAPAA